MANEFSLEVIKREQLTRGGLNQLRKNDQIPGIYYSYDSKESVSFYVERKVLREAHKSGARIFSINVGDKKRTVIFKSIQYHPVTDAVMHIDLYGVKMDQVVTINVEIKLKGTASGVIEEGGILVPGLNEISIECLPMDIPEFIELDISELELGDSLRVEDMSLDEKLNIKSSPDQIIASVTHPMKEEEVVTTEGEDEEEFIEEGAEGTEGDETKKDGDGQTKDSSSDDNNKDSQES